jgi:hypothetical protein
MEYLFGNTFTDVDMFHEAREIPSLLPPGMYAKKMSGLDKSIMGVECRKGGGGGGAAATEKFVEQQFNYDQKTYDYNWARPGESLTGEYEEGINWKKYNMATKALTTKKNNDEATRVFNEETQEQNWEHGIAIQDYSYLSQLKAFQKSGEQFTQQTDLNEAEYQNALERETAVLDEQFIQSAFENQNLILDLYETAGGKGYDQASAVLGLQNTEATLEYGKLQEQTGLSHDFDKAAFQKADTQLSMKDSAGGTAHQAASIKAAGKQKAHELQYEKALTGSGGADVRESKQRSDFENDLIRREVQNSRAKAAFSTTEENVKALQAVGQAQLSQAGRSQGKAVQMVLAQLGRSQAYTVESMMHESNAAQARMKQNRAKALNTVQRAAIADQKIDFEALQNIDKVERDTEESLRGLNVDIEKGELGLDQIRSGLFHVMENTDIKSTEIDRNLKHAQAEAGFDMKKIDWELDNLSNKFEQNQKILQTTLDSAVKASVANTKDIAQAKVQADLQTWANLMLEPELSPYAPKPIDLPYTEYDDIMMPVKPPKPIRGTSYNAGTGTDFMQSAMTSLSTGLSVGLQTGNPWAGVAAGLASWG